MQGFTTLPCGAGELLGEVAGLALEDTRTEAQREHNRAMEDTYQARRAAGGQTGFDASRFAGEMLGGYAIGGALPKAGFLRNGDRYRRRGRSYRGSVNSCC